MKDELTEIRLHEERLKLLEARLAERYFLVKRSSVVGGFILACLVLIGSGLLLRDAVIDKAVARATDIILEDKQGDGIAIQTKLADIDAAYTRLKNETPHGLISRLESTALNIQAYVQFDVGQTNAEPTGSYTRGISATNVTRIGSGTDAGRIVVVLPDDYKHGRYGILASSNQGAVTWTKNVDGNVTLVVFDQRGSFVSVNSNLHLMFVVYKL